jgi:hypothetical protein
MEFEWNWWCVLVIPALGRRRLEDQKFETSLVSKAEAVPRAPVVYAIIPNTQEAEIGRIAVRGQTILKA